jgi:uncharacterized SAM-binding protein YcdF (DUF218 family)
MKRRAHLWRTAAFGLIGLLVLSAWSAGLFIFVSHIPREPAGETVSTDAIVVLTGGSERLGESVRLLSAGLAKKLFVSGVHEEVDLPALIASLPPDAARPSAEQIACCIVLDHNAGNTRGNARETAQWMAAEGFISMRLVTANYHMPRSLLEFRQAMPGIAIVPHPVFPAQVKREEWWRWPGTAALMVSEYHKFLFALLRAMIAGAPPAD